ncbi:MAG: hypothetical protein ABFD83_10085 [Armatimonadota bacterium]
MKSYTGILYILAVFTGLLCATSQPCSATEVCKSATITLKHIQPSAAMWSLEIISFKDYSEGKISTWQANKEASAKLELAGINSVEPKDKEHILVISGNSTSVDKLVEKIKQMDIPPKHVQVKAEIIEMNDAEANEVDSGCSGPGLVAKLRSLVSESRARIANEPIISTITDMPAALNICSQEKGIQHETQIHVIMHINENKTISVSAQIAIVNTSEMHTTGHTVRSHVDLKNGESVVLPGHGGDADRMKFVILTAKLL